MDVQPYELLTEDGMKHALIEARGDIFIASQLLKVTAIRLNRAIQVSPLLGAVLEETKHAGKGVSDKQIEEAVRARVGLYRVAGLDALHDLATMPIDENSAQNQVKLAAAARLVGESGVGQSSGELEGIFRELRETYQSEAPRLRVVRERTTIETIPERLVADQDSAESVVETPRPKRSSGKGRRARTE